MKSEIQIAEECLCGWCDWYEKEYGRPEPCEECYIEIVNEELLKEEKEKNNENK